MQTRRVGELAHAWEDGKWSFIADLSLYGPFWGLAVGISIGRSDAVSLLGSTGWSSRI